MNVMPKIANLVPAVEPQDRKDIRTALVAARRLFDRGNFAKAAQRVQWAADTALVADNEPRALDLAIAATRIRALKVSSAPKPRATSALPSADRKSATPPSAGRGALPSLRPKTAPGRLKPPPLPSSIESGGVLADETIEVNPDWLENQARTAGSSGRSKRPSTPARRLRFAEAVRVWVGPNGEVEVFSEADSKPAGYVEALLVAVCATSGLAERLLKR
jgi:hypothetical protein